jgi:hypothetical protein
MNDKIKLLAEQAGLRIPDDAEYNSHVYRYALERFANSIVRECADYFGREGDRRFEVDGNWIAKTIKRNFGVE